jgi:hypothetical protein
MALINIQKQEEEALKNEIDMYIKVNIKDGEGGTDDKEVKKKSSKMLMKKSSKIVDDTI